MCTVRGPRNAEKQLAYIIYTVFFYSTGVLQYNVYVYGVRRDERYIVISIVIDIVPRRDAGTFSDRYRLLRLYSSSRIQLVPICIYR